MSRARGGQKRIRRNTKWNAFYNLSTLASYHFDRQLVVLDSVDADILSALQNGAPAARYKVLRLAAHEYTHWRDHVATLWGRRLLSRYFDGVAAWASQDVSLFRHILDAQRSIAWCASRRYYLVKGPRSGSPPPWHASLSLGLAFNSEGVPDTNDPIPFVRFWAPPAAEDTDLIIRMPISAASLAEVRAMYAEYRWIKSEEERYPNGGTPANSAKWLLEYGAVVYEEDNLEYTTALHLLANRTGAKLVWEIFEHASALAGIVLNFPASLVGSIMIPKMWDDTWGPDVRSEIGFSPC